MTFESFYPPQRTLMGPGPSDISPQVLQALSRPTVGHLDPCFISLMDEIKQLLRYAFQTQNELTFPISAPGSAGMEACVVNLVEPGDKVIVCRNGVFGDRLKENVQRCGGEAIVVDDEWGHPVSLSKVQQAFEQHSDCRLLAFVHAETSTGVLSDAKGLSDIAKQFHALTIVDTVTSLGGVPLYVDDWQLDAVYSGSQKCLSCVPGLSPVTFSERAVQKMQSRQRPVQSWFLDQNLILGYWGAQSQRSYHHTAPVNSLYALHESLVMLANEGLEKSWQRHRDMHDLLAAGLRDLDIDFMVDAEVRLPQLNAICVPSGVEEALVRYQLLQRFNLEIGAGLGKMAGQAWRVGLMGYGAREENVALCLHALEKVLRD